MLLMGHFGKDERELSLAVKAVTDYPVWIAGYFVLTMFVAGVAGKLSNCYDKKSAITFCLADHRELAMDEWGAFFNRGADTDALVTAVVEMGGKAYLFLGVLHQLHFDPTTAALDRIELVTVAKRPIEKPFNVTNAAEGQKWLWAEEAGDAGESLQKYEQVFGNQFILRMSEIKTLNVVYLDQKVSN